MKIAVALGKLGSTVHGKMDATCPFDDEGAFATGTVSGFWGIVWGLAERGHQIHAFADIKEDVSSSPAVGGASVRNIDAWPGDGEYDAYLSILETDILGQVKKGKPRIVAQWLNDFSYCKVDPEETCDLFACPSETHRERMVKKLCIPEAKTEVIPLLMHPEFYDRTLERRQLSIAYASSPDRGLHYMLEIFPEVRTRVPGAELRIYYRVIPWCDDMLNEKSQRGSKLWRRANSIRETFEKLGTKGENGIYLVGQLTTRKMIAEMCRTRVLAYPCDPVKFTEGFSVTVLDACASGCAPIISGVDAFPELWSGGATVIPGHPTAANREEWIGRIVKVLTDDAEWKLCSNMALMRAEEFTRRRVAGMWEALILRGISEKAAQA